MSKTDSKVLGGFLSILLVASAAAAQAPFTTTTIVNGNLTPVANGAALLSAVAAATPPALVKVEPGTYDLNGVTLVMRDLVDVEGSGRDVTFITSDVASTSPSDATVLAPAHVTAQLRGLTVLNDSAGDGTGVRIESDFFLLTGVNVETDVGGSSFGVDVSECNSVINDVFVRGSAQLLNATGFRITGGAPILGASFSFVGASAFQKIALVILGDADAQVDQFFAVVNNSAGWATAIYIGDQATVQLRNVRATAISPNWGSFSLTLVGDVDVDVKESTFTSLSDANAYALQMGNTTRLETTGSTFVAGPLISPSTNAITALLHSQASLDSKHSVFESSATAVKNQGTGAVRFGASQIIGSVTATVPSTLTCVFTYDGSFAPRAANCL